MGVSEAKEYEVKSLLLGHFFGYTTWPAASFQSQTDPIRLLVVGKDPFGKVLEAKLGKLTIGKRPIVIERSTKVPERIVAHAVFCGELELGERLLLIARVKARPILLIGETPGFAEDGACVNLYFEDTHVRFEVNPEVVKRNGLSLSSEMLKVAKLVHSRKSQ
jgi:hypothetical protein